MSLRQRVRSLVFACGILFALSSVRCALAAQPVLLVPPGPLILATVGISRGADLRIEVWKTQEEAVTRLVTGDAAAALSESALSTTPALARANNGTMT